MLAFLVSLEFNTIVQIHCTNSDTHTHTHTHSVGPHFYNQLVFFLLTLLLDQINPALNPQVLSHNQTSFRNAVSQISSTDSVHSSPGSVERTLRPGVGRSVSENSL